MCNTTRLDVLAKTGLGRRFILALTILMGVSCGCYDHETAVNGWFDKLGEGYTTCGGSWFHFTQILPWEVDDPEQWADEEPLPEAQEQLACLLENAEACKPSYGKVWTWSRDAVSMSDIEERHIFVLPSCEIVIVSRDLVGGVLNDTESICSRLADVGPPRWIEGEDCEIRDLESCE